jgi:hypothetical protein
MLKRRLKQAELPAHYSPHSFRATGIRSMSGSSRPRDATSLVPDYATSLIVLVSDAIGRSEFLNASNLNLLPVETPFRLAQRFITGFCGA